MTTDDHRPTTDLTSESSTQQPTTRQNGVNPERISSILTPHPRPTHCNEGVHCHPPLTQNRGCPPVTPPHAYGNRRWCCQISTVHLRRNLTSKTFVLSYTVREVPHLTVPMCVRTDPVWVEVLSREVGCRIFSGSRLHGANLVHEDREGPV